MYVYIQSVKNYVYNYIYSVYTCLHCEQENKNLLINVEAGMKKAEKTSVKKALLRVFWCVKRCVHLFVMEL